MRKFPLSLPVWLFLLALGLVAFMGYRWAYDYYQDDPFARARDEEQAKVAELTGVLAEAKAVKAYVASDQFVEQEARRRLGWVREGEVPIVVHSPPSEEPPPIGKRWWQRLFPH